MSTLSGSATNPDEAGVLGDSSQFEGVRGVSHAKQHGGVVGVNDNVTGEAGPGVFGTSKGTGVWGVSETWMGVYGETKSTTGGAGVQGVHKADGTGVVGKSSGGIGVYGESETHEGVHAQTKSTGTAAMAAYQLNETSESPAFFAKHAGNRTAGRFEGDVEVTGDIRLTNADFAEDFDTNEAETIEPGMVVVVGDEGKVRQSNIAYDKRVAGVISGAGSYRPAIVLDTQPTGPHRKPVALLGKVFCNVDATYAPIEIGDLLTTSATLGHAMKAEDPVRAFGSVIGKALRSHKEGRGLIPILISLQ